MKQLMMGVALAVGMQSGVAGAQADSHSSHGGDGAKQAAAEMKAPARPDKARAGAAYDAPFGGYRSYTLQEPPIPWRAANDAVRDIGGHVGLMKGAKDDAAQPPRVRKP